MTSIHYTSKKVINISIYLPYFFRMQFPPEQEQEQETEIIILDNGKQLRLQKPNCNECRSILQTLKQNTTFSDFIINKSIDDYNAKYEITYLTKQAETIFQTQKKELYETLKTQLLNHNPENVTGKKTLIDVFCSQLALLSIERRERIKEVYGRFREYSDDEIRSDVFENM